jgi:hypothetical protein
MYILAITGKLQDKPTILVVDEFPRVETRVTKDILSETRKFNLFAYLSCQYLGQLSKELTDSIVSNARNIIAFKINKQDAAMLSSIMEIKVEEYFKKHRATTELEESKKEMFVRLHQRECIVRLFDGAKYLLPMKVRIVDAVKWGLREGYVAQDSPPPDGQGRTQRFNSFQGSRDPKTQEVPDQNPSQSDRQREVVRTLRYQEEQDRYPDGDRGEGDDEGDGNGDDGNEPDEPEKPKPELPNPMTEQAMLRETPEAIYHLEKAKLAVEKGKTSGTKLSRKKQ